MRTFLTTVPQNVQTNSNKSKVRTEKIAAPMNIHDENEWKKTLHFEIVWKLVVMSGFSEFCNVCMRMLNMPF